MLEAHVLEGCLLSGKVGLPFGRGIGYQTLHRCKVKGLHSYGVAGWGPDVSGTSGEAPTKSHWRASTLALVEESPLLALGISSSFHCAHLWLNEEVPGQVHQRWCLLLRDGDVF